VKKELIMISLVGKNSIFYNFLIIVKIIIIFNKFIDFMIIIMIEERNFKREQNSLLMNEDNILKKEELECKNILKTILFLEYFFKK